MWFQTQVCKGGSREKNQTVHRYACISIKPNST